MVNRKSVLAACGALALATLMAASVHGTGPALHTNRLTFSRPVALPGLTLPAGTYVFELVVHTNPDVVVVRNDERSKVYYMAMTERVVRPTWLPRDLAVTFGEARPGTTVPLTAWYPIGEPMGHAFVYPPR